MPRAATYSRVSGDSQRDHGYSLPDQQRQLREWCESNGYDLADDDEITDGAWSGGDLQRPGLDLLRERVAAGGIDVVAVLHRDRLARGVIAQILVEEFAEHGTRLISLNGQFDDSLEGELGTGILDVLSGYQRKKIGQEGMRGKLAKARAGHVIAGRRPLTASASPRTATAMSWTKRI